MINPFPILLALFFAVPLLEIYVLIQVGGVIGAFPTIALVVLTAVVGAALIRIQGLSTFMRVRQALARGQVPAVEMMEGLVLVVSGALLLTPGFFTDALGFLGLVPPLRRRVIRGLLARMIVSAGGPRRPSGPRPGGPHTIEGEYRREDE